MSQQSSTELTRGTALDALEKFRGWQEGCLSAKAGVNRTIHSITYRLSAIYSITIKAHGDELVVSVQDHRPPPRQADV